MEKFQSDSSTNCILSSANNNDRDKPDSSLGWWHRRTFLEKCLCVVSTVMLLTLIALSCLLNQSKELSVVLPDGAVNGSLESAICAFDEEKKSVPVCMTKGCIQSANMILSNMDKNVNPCEDFYNFACGTFTKKIIPEDKTSISSFSLIYDRLQEKMKALIEANITDQDSEAVKHLKKFYSSCMDQEKIEQLGFDPLRKNLAMMGGWPVLEGENWNETNFTWQNVMFTNRKLGFSSDLIVDFSVGADLKNSSWRILDLDETSLSLSRKYLKKGWQDKIIQAYHRYMVDVAVLMGANSTQAQSQLKDSLLFEMSIANITMSIEDRRNITKLYNKMSLKEVDALMPGVGWTGYINRLLEDAGQKVTEDEAVIVDNPDFMKNLSKLLERTPKRVIANYLMWRSVGVSVRYLHEAVRDLSLKFSSAITGQKKRKPRWRECLNSGMGSFSYAAGSVYVKNYFDEQSRHAALDMVRMIHSEFDQILDGVKWMDPKTKEKAREKSKAIKYRIAYPKELLNDTIVSKEYEGLHLNETEFYENGNRMAVYGTNYVYKKLREKIDKNDWKQSGGAAVVNAFYSPTLNSIIFPAGILQGVFYASDRPDYLNFGAIGFVIGHEITHGFDDGGRRFNKFGDIEEWWEPQTKKKFLERAKCMIEQYGNVTYDEVGVNINGELTQGENIADNGGIKQSRIAYQMMIDRRGEEEPALPGLQQYSGNQLFWLSAANAWCSVVRPASLKLQLLTNVHSPPRERVNIPLSNLPQFANDWKCPQGSKMNPTHRCSVW